MSKRINPKVSIICAAYNEEKNFEEHLKSLVYQTYKNKEIIIVDDGSTDNTAEIGKKFARKYKFVKLYSIKHKERYGCVRPRIEAIKNAMGDVLCIVDADGYYEKNNIKDGIKRLFSSDKIAAVVPRMHAWDPDNFIAKYRAMVYESRFIDSDFIQKGVSEGGYSPWLLKRAVYDAVGGYNINDAYCEDLRLARRILDKGYKILHEPKCHWKHRLGETVLLVIKKNFDIGRMHASKKKLTNIPKVFYFTLPIAFLLFGIFNYFWFLLFGIHFLPMLLNGIKILYKVRNVNNKFYALFSPIVSYIINIPYAFGFYFGLIFRHKN